MPSIVTVQVQQQIAATPSLLQRTGAFVSQGGTNTSQFTLSLLTQLSDLTPLLNGSKAVTGISQTTGTATVTTTSPHGFTIGDTLEITISGASPAAYDGTFLCTVTGASAFTYAVPSGTSSPATGTIIYTLEDVAELFQMATTFFAQQGGIVSVYVIELGAGNATDGATSLTSWLTANPGTIYSFLVPRTWDANAMFLTLAASYESTTAKTYFWTTTTLATYSAYTPLMKCINALIEAPAYGVWSANVLTALSETGTVVTATTTSAHGVAVGQWFQISGCTPTGYNGWWQAVTGTTGSTLVWNAPGSLGAESVLGTLVASYYASTGIGQNEFSQAMQFWRSLAYKPSSTNKVAPFAFGFGFGITPFPTKGNSALLTTLKTANISYIGTGAEGGISDTINLWGTMLDGNPFNYWYSVDWVQINEDLQIANAVINGSNTSANPLYYNQDGINRLQNVAADVMGSGVTFGLVLGNVVQVQLDPTTFADNLSNGTYANQAVVNAVPFVTYLTASPDDYKIGEYDGLTAAYVPQQGFTHILFNIEVSNLPVP